MYPEVKAYDEACDAARAAYVKARSENLAARQAGLAQAKKNDALPATRCCATHAYEDTPLGKLLTDQFGGLLSVRNAALQSAWDALKGAADPLVRWIAENCDEYRFEADSVLRALPASPAELDALARVNGWCETWDSFRLRAEQADVLPAAESEVTK